MSRISSNLYDVAVVGGGPAGSSAAYQLAREGIKVALLEKCLLPRYKTCGGGIVYRALQMLPTDIEKSVERQCYRAELNLQRARLHFSINESVPIVSMTMREQFDFLLVEAAQAMGTRVFPNCEVIGLNQLPREIELATSQGTIRARFLIAADGAQSRVARLGGWERAPRLIPALEWEVPVGDDLLKHFARTATFDFDLIPWGYAWVFPKKAHLSVGILNMCRSSSGLNRRLGDYLQSLQIHPTGKIERHGFVIPVSPRPDLLVKGRILLAGDAAGLADPVTGEGISFAIQSGQLAARALVEGEMEHLRACQLYQQALALGILKELRVARMLAGLLYRYPVVRTALFRFYGHSLCRAMANVLTGKTSYRAIIGTASNYLKLLRFRASQPVK